MRKRRLWRLNAHLIRNEDCEDVVRDGWATGMAPDYFDRLFRGIEACQLGLRQWSHNLHNYPRKRIKHIWEELHNLELVPQMDQTKKEKEDLRAELEKIYLDEDILWRQRSKILWAREGDQNTVFFHSNSTAHKQMNMINGLYS